MFWCSNFKNFYVRRRVRYNVCITSNAVQGLLNGLFLKTTPYSWQGIEPGFLTCKAVTLLLWAIFLVLYFLITCISQTRTFIAIRMNFRIISASWFESSRYIFTSVCYWIKKIVEGLSHCLTGGQPCFHLQYHRVLHPLMQREVSILISTSCAPNIKNKSINQWNISLLLSLLILGKFLHASAHLCPLLFQSTVRRRWI